MRRRGRPPHPDILTPRQWEVLDLVRQGLSDQAIADELDLTLAGAKYHVSEILTKLGVSSREEAAAWQPDEEGPLRWQRLTIPTIVASIVVAAAAIVGLILLAWGVLETSDSPSDTGSQQAAFEDLSLPDPVTPPQLSREQALIRLAFNIPEGAQVRAVHLEATTASAIDYRILRIPNPSAAPPGQADEIAATIANIPNDPDTSWLVRFHAKSPPGVGYIGFGLATTPPLVACREFFASARDSGLGGSGGGSGSIIDDDRCNATASREAAILVAGRALRDHIRVAIPDLIEAELLPVADANRRAAELGAKPDEFPTSQSGDVWLVTIVGHFQGPPTPTPTAPATISPAPGPATPKPSPSAPPTPGPTTLDPCHVGWAIISVEGALLAANSVPHSGCP